MSADTMRMSFLFIAFLLLAGITLAADEVFTFDRDVPVLTCSAVVNAVRHLEVYRINAPSGPTYATRITLVLDNNAGQDLYNVTLQEHLPETVAQTPEDLGGFSRPPHRFLKGSVVVEWLFDHVQKDQQVSVSFTVNKKLDPEVLDRFPAPRILYQTKKQDASLASIPSDAVAAAGLVLGILIVLLAVWRFRKKQDGLGFALLVLVAFSGVVAAATYSVSAGQTVSLQGQTLTIQDVSSNGLFGRLMPSNVLVLFHVGQTQPVGNDTVTVLSTNGQTAQVQIDPAINADGNENNTKYQNATVSPSAIPSNETGQQTSGSNNPTRATAAPGESVNNTLNGTTRQNNASGGGGQNESGQIGGDQNQSTPLAGDNLDQLVTQGKAEKIEQDQRVVLQPLGCESRGTTRVHGERHMGQNGTRTQVDLTLTDFGPLDLPQLEVSEDATGAEEFDPQPLNKTATPVVWNVGALRVNQSKTLSVFYSGRRELSRKIPDLSSVVVTEGPAANLVWILLALILLIASAFTGYREYVKRKTASDEGETEDAEENDR